MKTASNRSMKSLNMTWLVMLAVLDTVFVMFFVAPEMIEGATLTGLATMRALVTPVMPVAVLLLTGLLSPNLKAVLVYWKVKNPLPGCAAFTKHAPADPRIDMSVLKKNVGALPTDPVEQNSKWYKLYKMVVDDRSVVEANKLYLMYRDMAAMSLPLIILVPFGLWIAGASTSTSWIAVAFFAIQFLVCSLSARNSGIRLVTNVLAIHSARKVTAPKSVAST